MWHVWVNRAEALPGLMQRPCQVLHCLGVLSLQAAACSYHACEVMHWLVFQSGLWQAAATCGSSGQKPCLASCSALVRYCTAWACSPCKHLHCVSKSAR